MAVWRESCRLRAMAKMAEMIVPPSLPLPPMQEDWTPLPITQPSKIQVPTMSNTNDTNPLGSLEAEVLKGLGELGGVVPEIAGTVIVILGALFRLVRSSGDSAARMEALMTVSEAVKAQLDKEKFPDEGV